MDKVVVKKHKRSMNNFFLIIFLVILSCFLLFISLIDNAKPINNSSSFAMNPVCYQVSGTPAWIKNNVIIGYGSGFPEDYSKQSFNNVVTEYLIPNKIIFVWDPKCIHCQREIARFGSSWVDYVSSGLTRECHLL